MPEVTIDALCFKKMFIAGANALANEKELINELNVFPVPDGDTGTNMTMTVEAAVEQIMALPDPSMDSLGKAISSGSLRGARGNSGVILSQLFRGFTKGIREYSTLDAKVLAAAMTRAVETAYKAVMKPKEGTILTVAKSMAVKAEALAEEAAELSSFFAAVLQEGDETLERTPELLPVLKEAGVVDSGGKGLMCVMHGAVDAYNGKTVAEVIHKETVSQAKAPERTRGPIETDDIKFGYCTEFIILPERAFGEADEAEVKAFLSSIGDSLVCVADEDVVKIHVHTNDPGLAIQKALTYGQLTKLKIDNMREEHRETLFREAQGATEPSGSEVSADEVPMADCAFIAVAAGDGLTEIFAQLGVNRVISGGQSMNPSTDDFLSAIEEVHAKEVFLLPNNKNIILAANQAAALTEGCTVHVIPSVTIPQGIAAMVGYVREYTPSENVQAMTDAITAIASGEVTYAVHDAKINGKKIKKGDIMGIGENGLLVVGKKLNDVVCRMLKDMITKESELISVYFGQDFPEEDKEPLTELLEETFPDFDIEVSYGGQPVYYCIVSVE